jgi:hypothetical protein
LADELACPQALLTVHSEMLHQLEIIQGRCPQYDGLGEVFLTMVRPGTKSFVLFILI